MSYHQRPTNQNNYTDAFQTTSAGPPAEILKQNESNSTTWYLPQKPNQDMPRMYLKKGHHEDPHVRTASSSSGAASHHSSNTQKTARSGYGNLPAVRAKTPSIISLPVTLSDCDTDSNEGSGMDNATASPTAIEQEFCSPEVTQHEEFSNHPSRIFNSSNDEISQLATGTHAKRPSHMTATEASYIMADFPLEKLYDKGLTSYPHQTVIEEEMKTSLLSLLSIDSFEYMLAKPETRNVFRDWLISQGSGKERLDRWTEESRINQLHVEAQETARHLLDHFHHSDGKESTKPSQANSQNNDAFKEIVNLAHSSQVLVASRQKLLESLYSETFKQFITSKLLEITKMKLRSGVDEKTCKGLGDSFVVSNPRLRDNPVVMVSPSFSATTGHERNSIIGKNCRFLQGPGTSPQSIQRLRIALMQGLPCVELLLNYKKDGTPFYCLLSITPLFDENGFLSYYIGGQINVTDELRTNQIMALISQTNSAPMGITSEDFKLPESEHDGDAGQSPKIASINPTLLRKTTSSIEACQIPSNACPKPFRNRSYNWFNFSHKAQEKAMLELEFTNPDDRNEFKSSSLSESLSAFSSTYSRLILFNQANRSIVFVTPEALNFLGFPTKTMRETYSSALLHHDFFDVIGNCKTKRKTPLHKKTLKKVVAKNSSASFECELCWSYTLDDDNAKILFKHRKKVQVAETSVVHLTPLIDKTGNCGSYVAVLS